MWVAGQRHAPAAVPQELPGTHSIGRWVGPEEGLDRLEKFHSPTPKLVSNHRTIQPVVSRYTD